MRLFPALAIGLALFLGESSVGWAYIPPSPFIVKNLLKKHELGKGLRLQSTVSALENDQPIGVVFKQTTFFNPATGILKSWATDGSGQVLYSIERKDSREITAVTAALLLPQSAEAYQVLARNGIPVSKADSGSLSRWHKSLAWVIGPKGQSSAELWVEKDTFLPVRLFFAKGKGRDQAVSVEFENYRFQKEYPFPRAISASRVIGDPASKERREETFLREETFDISVNIDTSQLRAPTMTGGFTEAGQAAPEHLRELIRKYYELFR